MVRQRSLDDDDGCCVLQVAYRFATSTGASFISHYIADAVVAPPELCCTVGGASDKRWVGMFSEKLVLMPGSYLPNSMSSKFPSQPSVLASQRESRRQVLHWSLFPAVRICTAAVWQLMPVACPLNQTWAQAVRLSHQIPAGSIVLACFNRALKIDAITFQVWMR